MSTRRSTPKRASRYRPTTPTRWPCCVRSDNTLSYRIVDNTLVVMPTGKTGGKLYGLVLDENGEPISGVVVHCGNQGEKQRKRSPMSTGALSSPPAANGGTLTVSFIGYKKQELPIGTEHFFCVHLKADVNELDDVIVTGYAPKAKNSFTGTAVQVKGEELRTINNTSFFDALKVFDPSFKVVDSRELFGSDPNFVPSQIDIRGQNSFPDIVREQPAHRDQSCRYSFSTDLKSKSRRSTTST